MERKKRNATMDATTIIMVIIALGLLVYALFRGENRALLGIKLAGETIWNNLPRLLAGFLMAGLMQVLLPKELIARWLGNEAGVKAILIGCIVGGLIPGSPYVVFPIIAGLYKAGAGIGSVVGYITAWSLWSVSRLPVEMGLIEPKVALIRYAITFVVPPLAGLLAHGVGRMVR